jgi:hypothetical protein
LRQNIQEMPEQTKPLLAAAFLCERVLEDKDSVLSAIRIVDTFTIVGAQRQPPQGIQPNIALTLLISLKAGNLGGKHQLKVFLQSPSGKELKVHYGTGSTAGTEGDFSLPFDLKSDQPESGINVVISCAMPIQEFGVFYFVVLVDDEELTKIPFKLREAEH